MCYYQPTLGSCWIILVRNENVDSKSKEPQNTNNNILDLNPYLSSKYMKNIAKQYEIIKNEGVT